MDIIEAYALNVAPFHGCSVFLKGGRYSVLAFFSCFFVLLEAFAFLWLLLFRPLPVSDIGMESKVTC